MSFNQLFEYALNDNDQFVNKVSAVKLENGLIVKNLINLRLFSKYNDKYIPTKFGICVSPELFERIIPLMESLRPFVISEDQENIEFRRAPNTSFLYEIEYNKANGKNQVLSITEREIKKLCEIKNQLLSYFN